MTSSALCSCYAATLVSTQIFTVRRKGGTTECFRMLAKNQLANSIQIGKKYWIFQKRTAGIFGESIERAAKPPENHHEKFRFFNPHQLHGVDGNVEKNTPWLWEWRKFGAAKSFVIWQLYAFQGEHWPAISLQFPYHFGTSLSDDLNG